VAKQSFGRPRIALGLGTVFLVCGLVAVCLPSGREAAALGLPGALGLPVWVLGAVLMVLGSCFIVMAWRQLRRK